MSLTDFRRDPVRTGPPIVAMSTAVGMQRDPEALIARYRLGRGHQVEWL